MSIGDFLHSNRWKLMQNYIYSWGASVVLIGALFKLEHLPGASVFLGVGLSIEAIIFFVSAFEPLMDLPDWKAVYPQLRTGDEHKRDLDRYVKIDEKYDSTSSGGGGGIGISGLPEDQLKSLKDNFDKLSNAAKGISDITLATTATQSFVKNLNEASLSIGTVVDANKKVSAVMDESVAEVASSYKLAAEKMKSSAENSATGINSSLSELSKAVSNTSNELKGSTDKITSGVEKTVTDLSNTYTSTANELKSSAIKVSKEMEITSVDFGKQLKSSTTELNTTYKEMTNSMSNGFKGLEKSSGKYVANLDKLNKNLSAINTAYELHLKGTNKVESMVNEYSKGVGEIGKLLNNSVEETKKFNQNTKEINENIQALNNIYGKMLGALNGKK
ncbi:MAG: gliding motility protein GldL [Prolixibacteraceae bacterium]|jgi:gliding motility-associated protein GldL|nr:gliding motility protein GldL [Prolixibacteraceae bacterium]